MNLTDIDLSKAEPIDFDDIREGDTVMKVIPDHLDVFVVGRIEDGVAESDFCGYRNTPYSRWYLLDRPVPPQIEPGTTGTATVRGVPGVRVMAFLDASEPWAWVSTPVVGGYISHRPEDVADFVADPAPGIPQDAYDRLRELSDSHSKGYILAAVAGALRLIDEVRDV